MGIYGMVGNRMIKKMMLVLISLMAVLIIIFLVGNNYNMSESTDTIPTTMGKLSATITHPKHKKATGIIVFVHGDGAQNATQDGGYKPLMERFARQGFISVSWDKLGVGKSTGDWLSQTMDDRSKEVNYVISWLKKHYPKESTNLGLWGASQAGWVIPRVLNERKDIHFSILVGPALNWLRQGIEDTENHLPNYKNSKVNIYKAKQEFLKDSKMIEQNNSYNDYKQSGGKENYNPKRYEFIRKNMHEDATKYLKTIQSDLYLILADEDINIDSNETEKIYSKEMDPQYLKIKRIPKVGHQMINPKIASSVVLTDLTAIMAPKYFLINNSYLDYCEDVAKRYSPTISERNE